MPIKLLFNNFLLVASTEDAGHFGQRMIYEISSFLSEFVCSLAMERKVEFTLVIMSQNTYSINFSLSLNSQ